MDGFSHDPTASLESRYGELFMGLFPLWDSRIQWGVALKFGELPYKFPKVPRRLVSAFGIVRVRVDILTHVV